MRPFTALAVASHVIAGYATRPLWKKLGLKAGGRLNTLAAPRGWSVPDLPSGADAHAASVIKLAAGGKQDVTVAFFGALAPLCEQLPTLARAVFPDGALWIAWPRRAAGHVSDIREGDIRDAALPLGLVDVKVAAIDEDWSGLRLVWRRERRT